MKDSQFWKDLSLTKGRVLAAKMRENTTRQESTRSSLNTEETCVSKNLDEPVHLQSEKRDVRDYTGL